MKIIFSKQEIREILLAAVVLSVAFALGYSNGLTGVKLATFPVLVLFSFVAVGIGFLSHELIGHKLFAQKFGMFAEFRMWKTGLLLALVTSLFGFIFAAPGAVYIAQRIDLWGKPVPVTKKNMGIVSLMGPIINIIIAGLFLALHFLYPINAGDFELFSLGTGINIWLGLFNMLPIPPLDGSKVLAWNRKIFGVVFALLIALFLLVFVL